MKLSAYLNKKSIAAVVFFFTAISLATTAPSTGVAWSLAFLLLTVYLFVFEVVSVDVAAIAIMVLLGLTELFAPIMGLESGLVDADHIFDGFASNAVISIIAVMILGAGLDKTGIMSNVANIILKLGGKEEKKIIPVISGSVGIISSFMQNVGAAALFIPVINRISNNTGLPMSRLLMPMGFCAILGGTVTMIGSSPLILLNDLLKNSNTHLDPSQQMESFGLFSVTPIGLTLVAVGIVYFMIAGRFVLPVMEHSDGEKESTLSRLKRNYNIDMEVIEVEVTDETSLIGANLLETETKYHIRVVAIKDGDRIKSGVDHIDRNTTFKKGQTIGLIGLPSRESTFIESGHLLPHNGTPVFGDLLSDKKSGIAEIVIPPSSNLVGKSAIDVWLRKRHGISLMGILRNGEVLNPEDEEVEEIRAIPFQAGDLILVYSNWEALERVDANSNFIVVTSDYPRSEKLRTHKVKAAVTFFLIAISLVLFTEIKLSIALLTGAIGMVVSQVLTIDEAYKAVSWKTVFLLASLIPLGLAVETTGTAKWIADQVLSVVGDMPVWGIQGIIAILATAFSLVMSNVGATVLLVPLAINIAIGVGANPAMFALTVALATSNSFIIPTHQVNALIMGPAGYRVTDFIRAGGVMTALFLVVLIGTMNLFGYN